MASMGHDWGHRVRPGFTLKRWPSCSSTHRPVDAIMELIRINQLSAAEIESIRVGLGISALRELAAPDPADGEEAKFSVSDPRSACISPDRANAPENYNRETIRLPEVQNIIRRTELYHEPRYDDLPSDAGVGPAFVTICCKEWAHLYQGTGLPGGASQRPHSG